MWESRLLSNRAMLAWLALIFYPLYAPYLPAIEGQLLPVYKDVQMVSHRAEGMIVVEGHLNKVRDCQILDITWYVGDKSVAITLEDLGDGARTRQLGWQTFGPWMISTPTLTNSKVEVVHKCHPLWPTRTVMFENLNP